MALFSTQYDILKVYSLRICFFSSCLPYFTKISKLRQCCDSFCVHNLQETTLFALLQLIGFVCNCSIENILSNTPIVVFCIHDCNCQHFYRTTTFVWTIDTITINIILLQLLTFICTMVIFNFLCTIKIDNFCLDYCMLQTNFNNVSYCNYQYKLLLAL